MVKTMGWAPSTSMAMTRYLKAFGDHLTFQRAAFATGQMRRNELGVGKRERTCFGQNTAEFTRARRLDR